MKQRDFSFPAMAGGTIILSVPTPLNEYDFERLTKWLELMHEPLTEKPTEPKEKEEQQDGTDSNLGRY